MKIRLRTGTSVGSYPGRCSLWDQLEDLILQPE